LPNLELVIHAELPTNQDTLLHRSGRTGRAGRKGISALIVPPAAQKKAQRLLGWAKLKAEWGEAPSAEEVSAKDDERMLASSDWTDPVAASDAGTVEAVVARFSPEQIAAAYVRLYRDKRSAPEELSDPSAPAKPREAFGPSVWFSLDGGHNANAEPRRLLPMLCKMGNISRDDIGAIRIQKDASLIEIRQSAVAGFLDAIGPEMALENGAKLEQMKSAPSFERGPGKGKGRGKGDAFKDKQPTRKPSKAEVRANETNTPPVDWNDAPAPRRKKPKPGAKGADASKPKYEPKEEGPRAEKWKPRKSKSGAPSGKASDPSETLRGPKPPKGKPSSKKNRARKLAKLTAKGTATPGKPKGGKPRGKG
jgi:ATP-dependent RNA helicase DeaD